MVCRRSPKAGDFRPPRGGRATRGESARWRRSGDGANCEHECSTGAATVQGKSPRPRRRRGGAGDGVLLWRGAAAGAAHGSTAHVVLDAVPPSTRPPHPAAAPSRGVPCRLAGDTTELNVQNAMAWLSNPDHVLRICLCVALVGAQMLFSLTWPKHNLVLWNAFRTTTAAILFIVAGAIRYVSEPWSSGLPLELWGGLALALAAAGLWLWGLRTYDSRPPRTPWD